MDAYNKIYSSQHHLSPYTTSTASIGVSTTLLADPTGGLYGPPNPNGGGSSSDPSTNRGATNPSSSSDDSPPPTPVVVGSVFGSLAGITLIGVLILFILRWKRRKQGSLQLGSGRDLSTPDLHPSSDPNSPAGPMSMVRRASSFVVPAALASLTGASRRPAPPPPSSPGSDRGFVRVSGRKLPSVLTSGGNGYEDPFADPHLSDTSFYRDSRGFYGGTGTGGVGPMSPVSPISPMSPSPLGPPPSSPFRDAGAAGSRGSGGSHQPPRTPTYSIMPKISAPPVLVRPDALGRSHPSRDGSRNSRFTEEV